MSITVTTRSSPHPATYDKLSTDELRKLMLIESVFTPGAVTATFTDLDRLTVIGASPQPNTPLTLENHKQTGADFFLQRREAGVINVGGPGIIRADGKEYALANLDCLYIATGTRNVTFASSDAKSPPQFYAISCPSHHAHPTTLLKRSDTTPLSLGAQASANQRKIYQYIHEKGIKSSQLVMGYTELAEGSVWNTMPPHTHLRRSEIYFYFDMDDNIVAHFGGDPQHTRHFFIHDRQAVLSPPWSIHCGCGTAAYKFIWAMAGENQTFDDMDKTPPAQLR